MLLSLYMLYVPIILDFLENQGKTNSLLWLQARQLIPSSPGALPTNLLFCNLLRGQQSRTYVDNVPLPPYPKRLQEINLLTSSFVLCSCLRVHFCRAIFRLPHLSQKLLGVFPPLPLNLFFLSFICFFYNCLSLLIQSLWIHSTAFFSFYFLSFLNYPTSSLFQHSPFLTTSFPLQSTYQYVSPDIPTFIKTKVAARSPSHP